MGLLLKGQWVASPSEGTQYRQQSSVFRNWITVNGEPGPHGENGFKAEKGRYHLYVSLACPWAHRTLIFRTLMQLEDYIDVTVVDPLLLDNGWQMKTPEPLYQAQYLYQLYLKACPTYEGRVSVPVLWDTHTHTIVSNESADIIRMFNSAFNHLTGCEDNYAPTTQLAEIDEVNTRIFTGINRGVYQAGFATSQADYEDAVNTLFDTLDWVETRLTSQRYLIGETVTEADWRLFTSLIRFDAVYFGHFKCNRRPLTSYPAISDYLRELYQWDGIASTINIAQIKQHYYASHLTINPSGIVPLGPELDFTQPHNRALVSQMHDETNVVPMRGVQ